MIIHLLEDALDCLDEGFAIGYFCTTSGNITNKAIIEYIENHDKKRDNAYA